MKAAKIIGICALILFCVAAAEILRGPRSHLAGFDRARHRTYEAISIGSSKGAALQGLGEPLRQERTFCLPQRHGFEEQFEAAERSSAVEYALWHNGINWYYCIGFDSHGKVVIKGEGCS